MPNYNYFIHPQALCESKQIGANTKIWAFSHIMEGAIIGENCNICGHTFIESGAIIGNGATIKNQVMIWEGIVIEEGVFIGPGVIFTNDSYPRSPRLNDPDISKRYNTKESWLKKTYVKYGATIGAGSIIVPGINIGRYALIAAGTVVTKNIKDHQFIRGNPGKPVGWVGRSAKPLRQSEKEIWVCDETDEQFCLTESGLVLR
jgi:UDP-2-acetamido-3-amino-2,3-dideoxy-glucuronate N-acetyltransferase